MRSIPSSLMLTGHKLCKCTSLFNPVFLPNTVSIHWNLIHIPSRWGQHFALKSACNLQCNKPRRPLFEFFYVSLLFQWKCFVVFRYKQNYERMYQLKEWQNCGGVMVMGYDMFRILTNPKAARIRKKAIETFQSALIDPGEIVFICDCCIF